MDSMEVAMGLIAQAGDARSSCMEAIGLAKEGKFDDARAALERADDGMVAASVMHKQGLVEGFDIGLEMSGSGAPVSLLMVHAQDHLNLALVMRDVADEFLQVHQKLIELEGKG